MHRRQELHEQYALLYFEICGLVTPDGDLRSFDLSHLLEIMNAIGFLRNGAEELGEL